MLLLPDVTVVTRRSRQLAVGSLQTAVGGAGELPTGTFASVSAPAPPGGLQARILELLASVESGDVTAIAAFEQLGSLPYDDLGFARVDTDREVRQGAPEAIAGRGQDARRDRGDRARAARRRRGQRAGDARRRRGAGGAARAVAPDAEEDERARLAWVARDVPEATRPGDDRVRRDVGRAGRARGARARRAARHRGGRARGRRRGRAAPARARARGPAARGLRGRRRRARTRRSPRSSAGSSPRR